MGDNKQIEPYKKIAATICDMQQKRVLLVGDIMLDQYVDGVVSRISPEAPVPILQRSETYQVAGGAANVAHNLANLGLQVTLIGLIGADEGAEKLQNQLDTIPQLDARCLTIPKRPTTQKTRFRAQGQQILRVDEEIATPISSQDHIALLDTIKAGLSESPDIIILSDYAKGCLSKQVCAEIIDAAKTLGIRVITDPKTADFTKYAGSSLLTPNLAELSLATGKKLAALDEIEEAARAQMALAKLSAMLVTLGGQGMLYIDGENTKHLPATALDVFDVSGAGDTVVAAMAAALAASDDWSTAMDLANQSAGIVVGKSGTAALTAGEILSQIATDTPIFIVEELDNLTSLSGQWSKAGLSVGFTNGCFDLLHPGHIDGLKRASEICDKLIVGMNSDISITALKGPSRPVQNQTLRAKSLANLPFVDAVVIFGEDTPARLIDSIVPDKLIKGGDYNAEDVVGYETVTSNGGSVEIMPILHGHSTTRLTGSST